MAQSTMAASGAQPDRPRVSLAMPVYNGERHIAAAIRSILAQTWTDFELIITDNASTDATADICATFAAADPRIRYVRNDRNIGAAANYNRGYELARGDYLKWCAHDDLISKNYVEACLRALEGAPAASLAYGRTECVDAHDQPVPFANDTAEMPPISDPRAVRRLIEAVEAAGTCYPIFGLFRMSALRRTTLHRPYYGSDRALLAEAAFLGPYIRVEEAVFYNREHVDRSIRINDKLERSRWQNGAASRRAAAEHINLLSHLYHIAGRHGDVARPVAARAALLTFALRPRQVSRYALEALGLVSPRLAHQMRATAAALSSIVLSARLRLDRTLHD